jgi:hypothetical protein
MSDQLDLILIQKYKNILNMNYIINSNGNTFFNGNITINNNLNISGKSQFLGNTTIYSNLYTFGNNKFNNITMLSNLNISNNSILNNSSLISSNMNTLNLNLNNLLVNNTSNLNKNVSINSNLDLSNNLQINKYLLTNLISPINNSLNILANNINIGNDSSIVNIYGTTTYIASSNLELTDKILELNFNEFNNAPIDNGNLSGIEILGISGNGYIISSLDSTRLQIKAPTDSNLNYIATNDINNNLFISGKSLFLSNVTMLSNLNIYKNVLLNTINLNSTLAVSGTLLLNNIIVNSNLLTSGNTNFINNTVLNSSLNISGNTNIINNGSFNSDLLIFNNLNILGNNTINSNLNISNNNNILGKTSIINDVFISNNSNIVGNVSINSLLITNNKNNILGNSTIKSFLNISGTVSINNNISILSNLYVTGTSYFNNNVTLGSVLNQININGPIICPLNDYNSNNVALQNNIPIWGFYRTGGIVKICLNQTPPTIYLSGASSINVNLGMTYTDSGAYAIDYTNSTKPVYLSLVTGTTNIVSNVLITGTNTLITSTSILSTGNYTATYTATDSIGLVGYNYRLINIKLTYTTYYFNENSYLQFNNNYNIFNQNTIWTFETWIYPTTLEYNNGQSCAIACLSANENNFFYIRPNGNPGWVLLNNSLDLTNFNISVNNWYHYVVMRDNFGNIITIINGTYYNSINLGSNTTSFNLNPLYIGVYNPINNPIIYKKYVGYISQMKISNTNRYNISTIPFTPPTNLIPLSSELSNTLFYLGNNYIDTISNNQAIRVGNVTSTQISNYN